MPKTEAMEKRWFNLELGDAAVPTPQELLVRVVARPRRCQRGVAVIGFLMALLVMLVLVFLVLSIEDTDYGSGVPE